MRERQTKLFLKKAYEKANKDYEAYAKDLAELEAGREPEYSDELYIVRLITEKLKEMKLEAFERYCNA